MNADAKRLAAGFEKCRAITRKYGTSFYFATQFFPKETRNGIYANMLLPEFRMRSSMILIQPINMSHCLN